MSSRESKYSLPDDAKEKERLNLQHAYIKRGFNGNFAAPVDQILRKSAWYWVGHVILLGHEYMYAGM